MDLTTKLKEHFLKFKQRLETIKEGEELSTEQEYFETDEPFDDGYELIKEEYLLQVSPDDRSEILRKQGCSKSEIDEVCNQGDSWWTQTVISPFESYNMVPLSLMDSRDSLRKQVCVWFVQEHDLTDSQKKLNIELLSILKYLDWYEDNIFDYDNGSANVLERFLKSNENNPNLKVILDLQRGESGVTVLHAVSGARTREAIRDRVDQAVDLLLKAGADPNAKSYEGEIPLHYAAAIGNDEGVNLLLRGGANPNICDKQGKTPQQAAIGGGFYNMVELFLTEKQKELSKELCSILAMLLNDVIFNNAQLSEGLRVNPNDSKYFTDNLRKFLNKHKNDPDLKVALSIGKVDSLKAIERVKYVYWNNQTVGVEAMNLLLEAGLPCHRVNPCTQEQCSSSFLKNLTPNQERKLNKFLNRVSEAQDVDELEKVVDEAIRSGVRLGFNKDFSPQDPGLRDWYNFADYVIKRIGELKKNPKTASNIICKLISKGAILYNRNSMDIINELELEFKDHRTNMGEIYASYINNAHKFIKAAKRATNGRLNDVRIDNTTFYLEYSEDSTINVAMVTNEAKNLVLNQRNIQSRKDIIKIGKSEAKIITEKGIRNYTDLADGSDIVLTFPTSQGELEVRLYPDKQNEGRIRVEVNNQDLLEQLKNCGEKLGENCLLGGYSVYNAIEHGYFERSEKPSQSPSTSKTLAEKVQESRRNQHESISL
ncbi:MAG: ankyrin repeat domain-containing protein [Wolbachia sp.]